jgi:hypothetical protein
VAGSDGPALGAIGRSLFGHARGPGAAGGDRRFLIRARRRRSTGGSARRQPENQPQPSDVQTSTRRPRGDRWVANRMQSFGQALPRRTALMTASVVASIRSHVAMPPRPASVAASRTIARAVPALASVAGSHVCRLIACVSCTRKPLSCGLSGRDRRASAWSRWSARPGGAAARRTRVRARPCTTVQAG